MTTVDIDARIAELVKADATQMRASEYRTVADSLLAVRPCNALVFGCGKDSDLWASLMPEGGTLLFVENDAAWGAKCRHTVLTTVYRSKVSDGPDTTPSYAMDCWDVLSLTDWDWILVDGPAGFKPHTPGRLGPIAFASQFGAHVLIHDVHRPLEKALCEKYMRGRPLRTIHHLAVYGPKEVATL